MGGVLFEMIDKEILLVLGIMFLAFLPVSPSHISKTFLQKHPSIFLGCRININTSAVEEIMELPYIGQKRAIAIVDQRPYTSVEQLLKIRGIGEKTLDKVIPYISLKDESCDITY